MQVRNTKSYNYRMSKSKNCFTKELFIGTFKLNIFKLKKLVLNGLFVDNKTRAESEGTRDPQPAGERPQVCP